MVDSGFPILTANGLPIQNPETKVIFVVIDKQI